MIALASTPILAFQLAALNPQPNNRVTVTWPEGATTVLSVQPNGTFETRKEGTASAYELAQVSGDKLVFGPYGNGVVYVVPFVTLS